MTDIKNILSINFNHDGSGAILSQGQLAAFVNTERYSRIKKHPGLRDADLNELLNQAHMSLKDIDLVIMNNFGMDAPGIQQRYGRNLQDTWLKFKIKGQHVIIRRTKLACRVQPIGHLLMHNSLAFFTSDFDDGVCLAIDPTGFNAHLAKNGRLMALPNLDRSFFNAPQVFAQASKLVFDEASLFSAGKTMGLAPYGAKAKKNNLIIPENANIPQLLNSWLRHPMLLEFNSKSYDAALAFHAQTYLEQQMAKMLKHLYNLSKKEGVASNICLSGGTSLNSVANQLAFSGSGFEQIHLHPACGDDGTAIGAALYYWHQTLGQKRQRHTPASVMYSVRTYENKIKAVLRKFKRQVVVENDPDYIATTARLISQGKIIAWYQGASEVGPRALGNRSILADPRSKDMKQKLNKRVKFRESFRPFAPSVLNEHAKSWFDLEDSPYMLRVCTVQNDKVPAITHVDKTARIQTVKEQDNPNYYRLIQCFNELTGVPLLLNTSFNIKGEPIVETPADALTCFLGSGIDCLVFPEKIITKRPQKNGALQRMFTSRLN